MRTSDSVANIIPALIKFQQDVKNPKKSAVNAFYNGAKYATLDEVMDAVRPVLSANGLFFHQDCWTDGTMVCVESHLWHISGERLVSGVLVVPGVQIKKDGTAAFNSQGVGSTITYMRRYQASSFLGLASEEDDDGNTGTSDPKGGQNGPQGGGNSRTGTNAPAGGQRGKQDQKEGVRTYEEMVELVRETAKGVGYTDEDLQIAAKQFTDDKGKLTMAGLEKMQKFVKENPMSQAAATKDDKKTPAVKPTKLADEAPKHGWTLADLVNHVGATYGLEKIEKMTPKQIDETLAYMTENSKK